jgi:hypothetical protein
MSEWNNLVKEVYEEGKKKNPNYKLKDAMREASKRRGKKGTTMKAKKSRKGSKGRKGRKGRKTRRHHK